MKKTNLPWYVFSFLAFAVSIFSSFMFWESHGDNLYLVGGGLCMFASFMFFFVGKLELAPFSSDKQTRSEQH
jgi:hypothetical protein